MALVSIGGSIFYPSFEAQPSANESPLLMDAAGEKVAYIFSAPETGNLARVRFQTGVVTTGDTLKISFQDVDPATGFPDGTADQYRTLVVADTDDNKALYSGIISSDGTDTGTKRAVTLGEMVAVVFEFNNYVAGNLNLVQRFSYYNSYLTGLCYALLYTTSWAKQNSAFPRLAVEYDGGTYPMIVGCNAAVNRITEQAFSSSSNPDERGNVIVPPFDATCSGLWASVTLDAVADLILYDSANNVLGSFSLDPDIRPATSAYNTFAPIPAVTLAAGSLYRVSIKPTSTSTMRAYLADYVANAVLAALSGGTNVYSTTRVVAGGWTDANTKRYLCGLILSQLDDGAGGVGGLLVHPGMSGGMRG